MNPVLQMRLNKIVIFMFVAHNADGSFPKQTTFKSPGMCMYNLFIDE